MRARLAARRRRLGLAAPRRLRARHAARPRPRPGALRRRASRCSTPWPAVARTSSAPCPTQVGSTDDAALATTLWDLVWSGRVTGDTFAPGARAAVRRAHRAPAHPSGPRRTRYAGRRGPLGGLGAAPARPTLPARTGPPQVTGRWSLLPPVDLDPTLRAYATAELLLDRHGILTRGATAAEDVPGGFAAIYRVLGRAEEAGRVRRGYFVEGLGASQFGTTGAVDRLRSGTGASAAPGGDRGRGRSRRAVVLAASDPANPFGARPAAGPTAPSTRGRGCATPTTRHRQAPPPPARPQGRRGRRARRRRPRALRRAGRQDAAHLLRRPRPAAGRGRRPAPTPCGAAASGGITVEKADGGQVLGSGHPVVAALEDAGFHLTPRGLRMRR